MSFEVECPECQQKLRLPDAVMGKRVRCPGCGTGVATTGHGKDTDPRKETPSDVRAERPEKSRKVEKSTPSAQGAQVSLAEAADHSVVVGKLPIRIVKDSEKTLLGPWTGELTANGLTLTRKGKEPVTFPAGQATSSFHKGRVFIDTTSRHLELSVGLMLTYNRPLAENLVDFLNGNRPAFDPNVYRIPSNLSGLLLLPLLVTTVGMQLGQGKGVLVGALVGAVAGGLGGCALGICLAIVRRQKWAEAIRILGILGVTAVLSGIFTAAFFTVKAMTAATNAPEMDKAEPKGVIPEEAWKTFTPAFSGVHVLMPGKPIFRHRISNGIGFNADSVILQEPKWTYTVAMLSYAPFDLDHPNFDLITSNFIRYDLMNAKGAKTVGEETLTKDGFAGRQLLLKTADKAPEAIRFFTIRRKLVFLSVEGPGVTVDSPDVKKFFDSLVMEPE